MPDARKSTRSDADSDADELNVLGIAAADSGRLAEAEAYFRRGARAGSAEAAYNLGRLLEQQNRSGGAIRAYRRALALGQSDAHLALGNLFSEMPGRFADAEKEYRLGAAAGDTNSMVNLGVLYESVDRN